MKLDSENKKRSCGKPVSLCPHGMNRFPQRIPLTDSSKTMPEADGETEPLLHGPATHHLRGVVVAEHERIVQGGVRLVLDFRNS